MTLPNETAKPGGKETGDRSGEGAGRWGAILGTLAVVLVFVVGYLFIALSKRSERQLALVNQQIEELRHQVQRAEEQSQASAQQASQAAASAQTAAEQRDQAKQAQAEADAQAQLALEQANQAEQRAEEYRQQREAELARLQEVLGQIAETRRTAFGLVMTLGEDSIRFDFDQSEIKPQYRDILNRIAGVLMTLDGYSIYVYGYTDDIGTEAYNLQLSERRARAVRDVLVQAGVKPEIKIEGFGESDPRVPDNTPQARAANRRVEIGIVYTKISSGTHPAPER